MSDMIWGEISARAGGRMEIVLGMLDTIRNRYWPSMKIDRKPDGSVVVTVPATPTTGE
jgi:hypothetical protein